MKKKLLAALACAAMTAKIGEVYHGHRYRVVYEYCADERKTVGHTTEYPAQVTVYRGAVQVGKTAPGKFILGARGKSKTRDYIRAVVGS